MVRRWLVIAAGLFAIGELIDGVVYRLPPGIVFAVVLGLCTWWASRSHGWAPSAVLGLLALGEFLLVVFVYSRGETRPPGGGYCYTADCPLQSQSYPRSISPRPGLVEDRDPSNVPDHIQPLSGPGHYLANSSTSSRASSSRYWMGGLFMKYADGPSNGPPMPRSWATLQQRRASMMTPAELGESHTSSLSSTLRGTSPKLRPSTRI